MKVFFFEKKNQKTLSRSVRRLMPCTAAVAARQWQSFLVLFFKKELLSSDWPSHA
jgi:hypothetical protein